MLLFMQYIPLNLMINADLKFIVRWFASGPKTKQKSPFFSEYYSNRFKHSVRVKGLDTGVKSLSQENSAAKMDEDRR